MNQELAMSLPYEFKVIPKYEDVINKYISLEDRTSLLEKIPDSSTARLRVLTLLVRAKHPTTSFRPQVLQYAIGENPNFPRCIGAMIDRLSREDTSFPKDILSFANGKKNPSLGKDKEKEILAFFDR